MAPHTSNSYTLDNVADALVRQTIQLARDSSDALGERTDAITNLTLAAEALVGSAPELGLDACRTILALQDDLDTVTEALMRLRALADIAADVARDLRNPDEALDLTTFVARLERLADDAVQRGEEMADAYRAMDAALHTAWQSIEPAVTLMTAVNEIGADLRF